MSTTPQGPRNPQAKKQASSAAGQANRRAQLAQQRAAEAKKQRNQRIVWIAVGLVAVLVATVLAVWGITSLKKNEKINQVPIDATTEGGIPLYHGKAKPGAPKVELWSDFQCPACKTFEDALGAEFDKLAQAGEIDMWNHTLTFIEENPNWPSEWSTKAGVAAACAGTEPVDHYAPVFSAIYGFQPEKEGAGFSDKILGEDLPARAGITGDALKAYQKCYKDQSTRGFVKAVDAAGRVNVPKNESGPQKGGFSTPTYVVNGKKLDLSPLYDSQAKTWHPEGLLDLIKKNA